MLNLNYNSKNTANSVLIGDADIEDYLLTSVKRHFTVNVSQISIIYVLRKLIAQEKILPTDVTVSIDNIVYPIKESGRFVDYPTCNDLFDDCLDALLKRHP